jgi:hypothetical protein
VKRRLLRLILWPIELAMATVIYAEVIGKCSGEHDKIAVRNAAINEARALLKLYHERWREAA